MRRLGLLLLLIAALGLPACGGDDEKQAAETVPSTPELTVPGEGDATDETTDTDETDTTDSTDSTDTTGAAPPATTPSGGAPAPPPPPDSAENDTPPEDQAPQEFEQFCDQNPGACQ